MKKCTKKAQKMRNATISGEMINHCAIEEKKLATYRIKHKLTFNDHLLKLLEFPEFPKFIA